VVGPAFPQGVIKYKTPTIENTTEIFSTSVESILDRVFPTQHIQIQNIQHQNVKPDRLNKLFSLYNQNHALMVI